MEYVAIDFETANEYRESACAVGLAKFKNGEVVDTYYTLLKPPAPYDFFNLLNVFIHGIEAKDVASERTLGQAWPDLERFIAGLPLVAHNAGFDLSVIRRQLDHEGVEFSPIDFTCTMILSKYLLDLPILKLPYVVDSLGLEMGSHHNALDDAVGAGRIFSTLLSGYSSADELLEAAQVRWGNLEPGRYFGSVRAKINEHRPAIHHTEAEIEELRNERGLGPIDPTAPLFGKTVSFTGGLKSMTRDEARLNVEIEGGSWVEKPNKTTDFLVVGEVDLRLLRPGQALSKKMAKAIELREKGVPVEILDESFFLELLTPKAAK